MNIELENNRVYVQGEVVDTPITNHIVKDEEFYGFNLRVMRLSGQSDILPILVSKNQLILHPIRQGDLISVKGQFRSHNKLENEKRKLILAVFAKEVGDFDENQNSNLIELDGYICKPCIYRTTPFSREICDVLLAVNRNYNKSDYIPCIAWGNNAQLVSRMDVATPLKITGRIQSREYNKAVGDNLETHTAYEVSISKLLNLNYDLSF